MRIITILVGILALAGCSKLAEKPYSEIYTNTFYKTEQDAEAALVAAYAPLAPLHGMVTMVASDFSADQLYPRPVVGRNALTQFTYDADYSVFKSFGRLGESPQAIWQDAYRGIDRANWVIAEVPNTQMNAERRKQIIGEAYFLRALYHWYLTKNFGSVPVRVLPSRGDSTIYVGKSNPKEVYAQIYADLDKAVEALPSFPAIKKGRASKQAALCLYAKAALYNEDWATALAKAEAVINDPNVGLLEDPNDLYDFTKETEAAREILFAFQGESGPGARFTFFTGLFGPPNSAGIDYAKLSFGSIFAYQAFFDSFNPQDERRELLDTNYVNRQGVVVPQRSITPITTQGVLVKKYQDPEGTDALGSRANVPILRYADALLIAAEAEARLNGPTLKAYGYINRVRDRAEISDLQASLSRDQFINAVLQERSWEFFAEGDRWYDLTRTNTFLQVVPLAVNNVYPTRSPQPKHRYFPIPLDEVLANPKLEQNPEWK
ncbi:MAG TPA: RagB/SusD family nutrient uptake outer membrane protein [Flavisolibacter sp.]|jgi:hypothetical protein|nr:RagB/SusD family nutrient uptake outer membrane protein [Flavisolibacter sp.]